MSKKIINDIKLVTEVLSDKNRSMIYNFSSGDMAFDDYIKFDACDDMMNGHGVTYLVINTASNKRELVGYYTITTSAVYSIDRYDFEDDSIPDEEKRERFSPISAFLVKMFAVNINYQDSYYKGRLISSLILKWMIGKLYTMSIGIVGAKLLILCAIESAKKFYSLNNFEEFDSNMFTLFDKIDAQDNQPMYLTLHSV